MQSNKCPAARIRYEDSHESFLCSGERMNEGEEDDIHADIRWSLSQSDDGLFYHNLE